MVDKNVDLVEILPDNWKERIAVRLLYDTLSEYWNETIETQIEELINFRDFNNKNVEILNSNAISLGLDYSEDAPISLEEYRKLASVINSYNANFKGLKFIDVLNYIYRVKFSIIHLWAKGEKEYWEGEANTLEEKYAAFYEETQEILNNSIISGTGPWYPTSHYDLIYSSVDLQIEDIPLDSIRYLIEKLAPINWVLRYIYKKLIITPDPNLPEDSDSATKNGSTITIQSDNSINKRWTDKRSYIYEDTQYEWFALIAASNLKHNFGPKKITVDSWLDYLPNTINDITNIQFSRQTPAILNGTEYPINKIRFDNDNSIYLEPESFNNLYKTILNTQTVTLLNGTYTFSCINSSFNVIVNGKTETVTNSSYTFNITGATGQVTVTKISTGSSAKYQLEPGKYATSYIVGGIYRAADTLTFSITTKTSIAITYSNDLNNNIGNTLLSASSLNIILKDRNNILVKSNTTEITIPLERDTITLSIGSFAGINRLFINNIQIVDAGSATFTSNEFFGKINSITVIRN